MACWVVLVVFLCLHVFTARIVGGGCGCVFGLGIKRFSAAVCGGGKRAHCRVHVQHRVGVRRPCGGGCLRSQPAVVVLLVWVVCGGLFVICIVVASIFVLYCFLCFV